jgi:choline kinase
MAKTSYLKNPKTLSFSTPEADCFAITEKETFDSDDMRALVVDGFVRDVGKDLENNTVERVGFMRFSAEAVDLLREVFLT